MKIFLAFGGQKQVMQCFEELKPQHLLISFAYVKTVNEIQKIFKNYWPQDLLIDSGAFSVWTKGNEINLKNYMLFCKSIQQIVPKSTYVRFVNLDVLPGKFGERPTKQQREDSAQAGWANMIIMRQEGLLPIHVFHQHEDFKWLKTMLEFGLDYIGLSPANDSSMKDKKVFLDQCFSIVKTKVKTHGFAVTSHNQVLNYPFYSVDSSSWAAGAIYARTPTFKDGRIKMYAYKDKKVLSEFLANTKKEEGLMTNYVKHYKEGIRAFMQLEAFANQVWEKRGIKHNDN